MATDFNVNALTSSGGFKPTTKDTPIDIRSRVETESDILNIGGMNPVVVRSFNDGPYGNGGWYEGPVGLYSQEAFSGAAPSESRFIEKSFASSYAASAMGQEGTLEKNYLVYLPENY